MVINNHCVYVNEIMRYFIKMLIMSTNSKNRTSRETYCLVFMKGWSGSFASKERKGLKKGLKNRVFERTSIILFE